VPGPHEPADRAPGAGSGSEPSPGPASGNGTGVGGALPDGDEIARADAEVVDAEVVESSPLTDARPDVLDAEAVDDDPLATALAQRDEYLDSLRRLQAEFENYRKRVSKQQSDLAARAAASLIDKLLPVLDTLDLAAEHLGDAESTDAKALVAASSLLHGVLAKEGLERIDPVGEAFDPTAHEAVGHLPAEEGDGDAHAGGDPGATAKTPAGPLIDQVMRPGYRWHGTVVRPAMVMVRG
jgi:molecular chaperone GrpE